MSTGDCHGGHALSRTLATLIDGLPIELARGPASSRIESVVEDSRDASPGSLFVARRGTTDDGRLYIADALARGAVAVLADPSHASAALPGAALAVTADPAAMTGPLAERLHGEPGRALRLAGVTGTNGKTTVAHLVHSVLRGAGVRCGLLGTVWIDDGRGPAAADMTTPPAPRISQLLASMVANGCAAAALEVSSHALAQRRTAGLDFDVAVFTNLSGDHLDYHVSIDAYADAKASLFAGLRPDAVAVVNADDPLAARMLADCRARVISCSLADRGAVCHARIDAATISHTDVQLRGPWGTLAVRLPLAGRHNVANTLQAAAACWALGVSAETLAGTLGRCVAPPGRLEPVAVPGARFSVFVDYAHTDDALANVLRTLRPLLPAGGRLRVVFGCGGDRDRTKRPRMGRVAAELADELIVTSDNPRTEPPGVIIDQILAGVPASRAAAVRVIEDRGEAIAAAVGRVGDGDVVLIAGKGHEDYQIVGTTRRPFDDRRVAAAALSPEAVAV